MNKFETRTLVLAALFVSAAASGCKGKKQDPAPAASTSVAGAAPSQVAPTASAPRSLPVPIMRSDKMYVPEGPRLVIYPGKGVGPVRIGATRATIERLMEKPCEEATDTVCRYIGRALEFHLKDGKVERIHVHRQQRPAGGVDGKGQPREFGVFNGAILPDLRFGMTPEAIEEHLGKPKKVEKVNTPNPFNTTELHHYDGIVLEYDLYMNRSLIYGGARIPG